jgi:hypothetical protein
VHVDNRTVIRLLDANHDGQISLDEVKNNPLIRNVILDSFEIDGEKRMYLGIAVHLVPCSTSECTRSLPAPTCSDGVRNGNEIDVDCGGDCRPCWPGDACTADGDCVSRHCDSGRCRAADCTDGVRDGFETAVDCGYVCNKCPLGDHCDEGSDCQSGHCTGSLCVASAP